MARTIVVFGTRGGVGKSVVATNLAVALTKHSGTSVCLVDLDFLALGVTTKMLSLTPRKSIRDLLPLVKRGGYHQLVDQSVVRHPCGLDVLSIKVEPNQNPPLDQEIVPRLFQVLKQRYEYIVVDGGQSLSDPLIAALGEANLLLLVVTPDIISLYQTKWVIGTIESLLFPSTMIRIVLNRAESRGGFGSSDVKDAISLEVIGMIPSDGRAVGMSVNEGRPLEIAYPSTKIAEAFRRLAQTLVDRPELYVDKTDIPRHRETPRGKAAGQEAAGEEAGTEELEDEITALKQRVHAKLVEELDLKRLDLGSMSNTTQMQRLRERTARVITNLLAREVGGIIASQEVRAQLVREITDEALGYGPLEEFLKDPEITDILVNNKDQIYIERGGRLVLTEKKFMSDEQIRTVIERIVAPLGRRIDEANPMVDARLPDGSRVNAIIPPLSVKGPALSIRKFSRERLSLEDLIRMRSLNPGMAVLLRACVQARKNIVVSGGTGSGKTTLLNILSAFIPASERIITIEDSAELKLDQVHWLNLEARPSNVEGRGEVTVRKLFKNALRMRPDRIIIGECRSDETLDMLQAMNTGHDGSLTTVHANSPKDVIGRLDSLILMSNIELPIRAVREMVSSAIHLIVHTARLVDGSRKITLITELLNAREGEVQLRNLFVYHQRGVTQDGQVIGDFEATGEVPTFVDEVKIKGIHLPEEIFEAPKAGAASSNGPGASGQDGTVPGAKSPWAAPTSIQGVVPGETRAGA